MAAYSLDRQTAGCNSPHDWLMSLAMHLTALICVICGGENDTNGCHLAGFGEDVAFASNLVATHPPCRSATGIGYTSKKLYKMAGYSASYSPNSWWVDTRSKTIQKLPKLFKISFHYLLPSMRGFCRAL